MSPHKNTYHVPRTTFHAKAFKNFLHLLSWFVGRGSWYVFSWVVVRGTWLLFFSGCAVWRPLPFAKIEAAKALPENYENYYDYPAPSLQGKIVFEESRKGFYMKIVEIPLSLPQGLAPADPAKLQKEVEELRKTDEKTGRDLALQYTNRIEYYLPKNYKPGQKRPVILVSPILGGNMVVDHFAEYYAGRGYIAVLVHRKRMLWNKEEDAAQIERYLRTSVIRLRQALDWILAQPEVDPGRVGAFGISYGAILHSVLAAVDDRVKYHILALPGGPIADILRHCPDSSIRKMKKNAREATGWSDEKMYEEFKRTIRTDPIYLAPYIPKDRVQIYVALFDRVVGTHRSLRLWRAMDRPRLKLLPFGHYGSILILPYLQTSSYLTFKQNLK